MRERNSFLLLIIATLMIALGAGGCTGLQGGGKVVFDHRIDSPATPWNKSDFDNDPGKFTFALFSDLTGGEREHIFEVAVAQLNLLRPEMIINVGDLIEGGSDDPAELHRQWDGFDARANKARAPVFYVGGNHDLTGELLRQGWKERLGPRYYHFIYRNVLFLVLDTEDNTVARMDEIEEARIKAVEIYKTEGKTAFAKSEYAQMPERTSGTVSSEQADYFTQAIAANPDVRWKFVIIHKPAWQRENEKNFAAIEKALADRPYTAFYGHTYVYHHEQRHGRDYINLATTGGEQFPEKGRSMDHVTLVTMDDTGVSIANLLMAGILDRTGEIPLNSDTLEFEKPLKKWVECSDPRPQACTKDYRPVCGKLGDSRRNTYANGCAACSVPAVAAYTDGPCRE